MAKRKARKPSDIPKDESKADRFIRVVTPRVVKCVKRIQQIGLCTGSTYAYTPEQAVQIIDALSVAVISVKDKFEAKSETESGFKFNS